MRLLLLLLLPFAMGCQKYYLSLHQQKIDARYLASTHVGSPDPRQAKPPMGQVVVVSWWVPKEVVQKEPKVNLRIIFKDHTEQVICYKLDRRMGFENFFLVNEEFEKKKGILTYMAEIVMPDGSIYREWKHQLWINLITMDHEQEEETESKASAERINSSVEDQPKQGSVRETEDLSVEEPADSF